MCRFIFFQICSIELEKKALHFLSSSNHEQIAVVVCIGPISVCKRHGFRPIYVHILNTIGKSPLITCQVLWQVVLRPLLSMPGSSD